MRHPAQGATGDWVMPGLVLKLFPLCEFSLFDTPYGWISGSLGSWSQCSHSKGSGLDLALATWLSESAVALLCIIFILWPRWMKQHTWDPGCKCGSEMAGFLPELDTEAWTPVPQDRGYEGEGSWKPSFHGTHHWKCGNSRDPCYPRDRGNGGVHDTVARGPVFQVPKPQLPKDSNLVLQVVGRNLLTQTLRDQLFLMSVITNAFHILFIRSLWQVQLFWFLGNFSNLSSKFQ